MEICNLAVDKYEEFIKFNETIYPERKNVKEYFQYDILKNPLLKNKNKTNILLALNDIKQIIGQLICNPIEIYVKGNTFIGHNCYDLLVLKEQREVGIGSSIALTAATNFKPFIAIGITKLSKDIVLPLGQIIGNMYKFIYFTNVLSLIRGLSNSIFKKVKIFKSKNLLEIKFPKDIDLSNTSFKLVNSLTDWKDCHWSNNTFQFARGVDFLNWRFFKNPRKYYFYLLNDSKQSTYFVVKNSIWKGLNAIEVVDYRVPYMDEYKFKLIIHASKLLARKLNFDAIIIQSSHRFFDNNLLKSLFLKLKNPASIITNLDINDSNKKIRKRDFVFATSIDWHYRSR